MSFVATPPRAPFPRRPAAEPGPDLEFRVEGAEALPYAAAPTLRFRLGIAERRGIPVRSVLLSAQVRLDAPARGAYAPGEQTALRELFGPPERWGETMKSLLWTQATLVVPAFEGETTVELPVACTYDFEVVAAKYLSAVGSGDVPLEFLFSGTVFYDGEGGSLQAVRLSWEKEARFRMPASLWSETMDAYFPGAAWLRVRKDVFERLYAYRTGTGAPTWEAALESLLDRAEGEMP